MLCFGGNVWDQKESWQRRYEEAKEEGQADVCVSVCDREEEKRKGKERQRSLKNHTHCVHY